MRPLTLPLFLLFGCTAAVAPADPSDNRWPQVLDTWQDHSGTGASVGEPLAGFELPDQYGSQVDFRQFLGFVTVIEVGTVWCVPCQEAASTQQAFQDELQQDHPAWVISVLVEERDGGPPDPAEAALWADTFNLIEVPVVADVVWSQRDAWSITSFPTTLVVGPQGTVLHRHDGEVAEATLAAEVEQAAADHASDLRAMP